LFYVLSDLLSEVCEDQIVSRSAISATSEKFDLFGEDGD
jgi:hypothetical protein